ncbi:MAG: cupin domain-containing protein [Aestuariivirga sp.]|uniref:cupin domain-containing protein n=1 Tax=Aestuariivirga sp. TaxID=2650926 RepID=UPI0025B9E125|nr:cupin domain-containing protein [Aestuariivirga sp.]MCA3560700.1 cupin domain-containing protein [Aestuariivirga sp.]
MSLSTRERSLDPDVTAPDGSEVRILAATSRGSMAQFTLPPRAVSKAVAHRTVEEVWLVTHGQGRMWRKLGDMEVTADLWAGISVSIPAGAHFQFRNDGEEPLHCVGVTMPPWPGMDEAYEVKGVW